MKKLQIVKLVIVGISLAFLTQCKKDSQLLGNENHPEITKSDSVAAAKTDSVKRAEAEQKKIVYRTFLFPKDKKDSAMSAFNKEFSAEEQYTILALNRLDSKNKWRADTLAIPDKIDHTLMAYSPFPTNVEALKEVKKIVFFSYPIQAYALYERGKLIKWGPTSMGKKSAETKRGLMFANWKKELAISTVNRDWKLPYNVNVHNTLGIGWHQYDLPGFPASHSCLRLLMVDAKFLYNWVDTWILNEGGATLKANGTPVIVFGDYNWGGKKPWKYLSDDSNSNDISLDEINDVLKPHLDKILKEQRNREEVLSQKATEDQKPAA